MSERSNTPSAAPGQDRRRSLRIPLIVQRVRVQDERRTFFGYAKNISSGGLFIGTASPKDVGSRFLVEIPLPKPIDRRVRCTCEVVWNRPWASGITLEPCMGIQFLDLAAEDGEAIRQWIEASRERNKPW